MVDIFTLTCPSCSGKLQITNDIDRFACGHCGNEHVVIRNRGTVSIKPVVDQIRNMRDDVDRVNRSVEINNAELAVARIGKEITALKIELRNLNKKDKKGNISPGLMGVLGLFLFISGIGSIAIGLIPIAIFMIIFGFLSMISAFVLIVTKATETKQLKSRIADLEKKKQAYLRIINRGT